MVPAREYWNTKWVFLYAAVIRLFFLSYAVLHDYYFKVKFTDVDYSVYTDGANHVYEGGSPYERQTYRYSPLLALLLLPNVKFSHFGKVLFCSCDLLVGWMCLKLCEGRQKSAKENSALSAEQALIFVWWTWLANPLIFIVSARGNADSLVAAAVVATLHLMQQKKWLLAAAVHGGLAVQLKLYPVIFLPAFYLHIVRERANEHPIHILFPRKDIRHNFSPYFYSLYLLEGAEGALSSVISLAVFIPQVVLILLFALRFNEDVPFACFLSCLSFVAFNKVCTSQYFTWYFCFLPIVSSSIHMSGGEMGRLLLEWLSSQGLWLMAAYLFEFQSVASFGWMWMASLLFLLSHARVIQACVKRYKAPPGLALVPRTKRSKQD